MATQSLGGGRFTSPVNCYSNSGQVGMFPERRSVVHYGPALRHLAYGESSIWEHHKTCTMCEMLNQEQRNALTANGTSFRPSINTAFGGARVQEHITAERDFASIDAKASPVDVDSKSDGCKLIGTATDAGALAKDKPSSDTSVCTNSYEPCKTKPALSYIAMIAKSILGSPTGRLSLGSIYKYITDSFPYYRHCGPGWRNSVRHNLSLNECFVKAGRCEDGKGNYWAVHPIYVRDFSRGDFRQRRRSRRRGRKKELELSYIHPNSDTALDVLPGMYAPNPNLSMNVSFITPYMVNQDYQLHSRNTLPPVMDIPHQIPYNKQLVDSVYRNPITNCCTVLPSVPMYQQYSEAQMTKTLNMPRPSDPILFTRDATNPRQFTPMHG
ncbi:uncharacterized protein LOC100369354 [Saccoglossus kowalevskii]|uniref:Forkhead box protein E1-like n=1 Tax=Saccoglossus kowalevskii TaxID=10224 RepID=A0ABM0GJ11_SACKO|nr:PREDICTED: forkhead box protein E1-like [Saccoglossus kowalevskii]